MSQEQHTPTPADEALYASMLTTQVIGAIQQAYTDGKIADLETYNKLYEVAKKADIQVQKLVRLLDPAAAYNREMDERNRIASENRDKPWLPQYDGE